MSRENDLPVELEKANPNEKKSESSSNGYREVPLEPAQKPKEYSFGRDVGLRARDVIEAPLNLASYVPSAILDTPTSMYNLYQHYKKFRGQEPDFAKPRFTSNQQAGSYLADLLGLPKPEGDSESMHSAITQGGLGFMLPAGVAKLASPKTSALIENAFVGKTPPATTTSGLLSGAKAVVTNPRTLGVASGAASGAAGETARQAGYDPLGQMLASIVTGVPFGLVAPRTAPKSEYANLKASTDALNIRPPTPAMIDPLSLTGKLEGNISRQLGGAGPIANAKNEIKTELENRIAPIASSSESPATSGGQSIISGIKNVFMPAFKNESEKAWNTFDSHVPSNSSLLLDNTQQTLRELTNKTPNLPSMSSVLANPKVLDISKALGTNTIIDFESAKQIRSALGEMLNSPALVSDIPYADVKRLYGAITKDMESVAARSGPEALSAFKRANLLTTAGHQRIENFLQPLMDKQLTPENVFNAALSGGKEGASQINAVMRSIGPDNRLIVASNFLKKIATKEGEIDALEFARQYNKLDPSVIQSLFGKSVLGETNSKALFHIAQVGSGLLKANRSMPPPTGINMVLGNILHSVGGALGTGIGAMLGHDAVSSGLGFMGGVGAQAGGVNYIARKITSPGGIENAFTQSTFPTLAPATGFATQQQQR